MIGWRTALLALAVALVLLLGVGLAGVYAGRQRERAREASVQRVERARADSVAAAAALVHQITVDSLAAQVVVIAAAADLALAENRRLRQEGAHHAAADHAKDSALAQATSAHDSLPIVVSQRDEARAAYAAVVAADSIARESARVTQERLLALAEAHRLADSVEARQRYDALQHRNVELAHALQVATGGWKFLGLNVKNTVTFLAGVGAGYALSAVTTKKGT